MKPFILSLLCLTAVRAEPLSLPLTPNQLQESIRKIGPKKTLQQIFSCPEREAEFLKGVSTGESRWLQVVPPLRKVSDAGASEAIDIALAKAIAFHPKEVLALSFPLSVKKRICSAPFIEISDDDLTVYFESALSRLEKETSAAAKTCRDNLLIAQDLQSTTAASLLKEIAESSADKVAKRIGSRPALLEKLFHSLTLLEEPQWVEVAAKLRSVLSPATQKRVDTALRESLLQNPEAVLSFSERGLDLEKLCARSKKKNDSFNRYAVSAITPLLEKSAIQSQAQKCLKALQAPEN